MILIRPSWAHSAFNKGARLFLGSFLCVPEDVRGPDKVAGAEGSAGKDTQGLVFKLDFLSMAQTIFLTV